MESKLTTAIRAATASGRIAVIPYLPAGFPDLEGFWDQLAALDAAGADVIEIGVPFSDPVADGPVIEAAVLACLERGVTLRWLMEGLTTRAGTYRAALVLMGYLNPFLQYGLERLAADAAAAGISGCIIPDLPLEESAEAKAAFAPHGLALIPLVGLNTSAARMAAYAQDARGFVYMVSVLGTTGGQAVLSPALKEQLATARRVFSVPVALGFGITGAEQLAEMSGQVDAVVCGSALLEHLQGGGSAGSFLARFQEGDRAP